VDKTEEFKKISQSIPRDKAAELAFIKSKLALAQSLESEYPESVREFTKKAKSILGDESSQNVDTPPPGGVGYGT
jgi:hypothetical protein